VHIAGIALPAGAGNTNLRFPEIIVLHTDGIQHGLSGGLRGILRKSLAVAVNGFVFERGVVHWFYKNAMIGLSSASLNAKRAFLLKEKGSYYVIV
jgi:hypothetical protein